MTCVHHGLTPLFFDHLTRPLHTAFFKGPKGGNLDFSCALGRVLGNGSVARLWSWTSERAGVPHEYAHSKGQWNIDWLNAMP